MRREVGVRSRSSVLLITCFFVRGIARADEGWSGRVLLVAHIDRYVNCFSCAAGSQVESNELTHIESGLGTHAPRAEEEGV